MSDEIATAPTFNTINQWILYTEGNVQYRAKVVTINNADTFVSICKYTKGPSDKEYKPKRKQGFLPPKAFFALENNFQTISKDLRKLVEPDTLSMFSMKLY